MVPRLIAGRLRRGAGRGACFNRNDVHAAAAFIEGDFAIGQSEQGPVAPGADVVAGEKFGSALADQDTAGRDEFAAKSFYAKPFAGGISAVADAALTFLMCHNF